MVFELEYKSNRSKAITWFIVLLIITGLLMAFFPLMQESNIRSLAEGFQESLGEGAAKIFGLDYDIDFQELGDFIPFQFQFISLLLSIFVMQIGAASLCKEQSTGTIEYLYAQPLERSEIVTDKWLANFAHYVLVVLFLMVGVFGFSYLFSPKPFPLEECLFSVLLVFGSMIGMGLFFLFFGMFYSALSNRSSHAEGGSTLLVLLFWIIYFVLKVLGSTAGNIYRFFPFHAFNPLAILKDGVFLPGMVATLGVGILFLILSYIVYGGKELKF